VTLDALPVTALLPTFGSARRPGAPPAHERPDGVDDATVEALGKLGAALETAEDARGHLYSFHRLCGRADLDLQDALGALRDAGHGTIADAVSEVLVGRAVVDELWSFQLVERYDAQYLDVFRESERATRNAVGVTDPHLAEAEMKAHEQSVGQS